MKFFGYLLIISSVLTQNYRIMGTGLELDRLNDFEIIIDDFNDVANTIGFKKDYFETKINLLLNNNGTSPNISPTTNFLFVKIKFIDMPLFSTIENQYFASISISFHRLIGYDAVSKRYSKTGLVWHSDTVFVPIRINLENFRKDIMKAVEKKINQFSKSLLLANKDLVED